MQITTQCQGQIYGIIIYYKSLKKLYTVILPNFNASRQYAVCFTRIISIRNPEEIRRYYSNILFEDIKKR